MADMFATMIFTTAEPLLPPQWECAPLLRTERGEWGLPIRRVGSSPRMVWGVTERDCILEARRFADQVDAMVHRGKVAARQHLAKRPQDFDTSALPLFSDSHRQRELF
jgi:hypothetical protein